MFFFGKSVMLMAIGSQLVNASQIMILGRVAGLEAAATFSIGTKFYSLGTQLTGRFFESSAPALTEMFVRKEFGCLKERFTDIFRASLFIATSGAVALVVANATVVKWWTSGVIEWNFRWDLMLAALLLATTCSRCLVGLFGIAGNLRPVRNLYLAEAAVFIAIGIPAAAHFGIMGMIIASLLVHLLVTFTFSSVAVRRVLGDDVSFGYLVLQAGAIVSFIFLIIQIVPQFSSLLDFGLRSGTAIMASVLSGWFLIMSPRARTQMVNKARSALCNKYT
jgi:O-antigen/teichoic acid export membrane protein